MMPSTGSYASGAKRRKKHACSLPVKHGVTGAHPEKNLTAAKGGKTCVQPV